MTQNFDIKLTVVDIVVHFVPRDGQVVAVIVGVESWRKLSVRESKYACRVSFLYDQKCYSCCPGMPALGVHYNCVQSNVTVPTGSS